MMRKLIALPFEFVHVVGAAVFFTLGALMSMLNAAAVGHPAWLVKTSTLSLTEQANRAVTVATAVGPKAMWLAGAALIGALVAPFARGDGKKVTGWMRVACAAVMLVVVAMVWGGVGASGPGRLPELAAKSTGTVNLWHFLALAGGIDLLLLAFAVTGGAAAKKSAGDGSAKK